MVCLGHIRQALSCSWQRWHSSHSQLPSDGTYYAEITLKYLTQQYEGCYGIQMDLHPVQPPIGPFLTVSAVWTIADIFNGLMDGLNHIALVVLSGVVAAETKSYFKRLDSGHIQEYGKK
ncbi:MAG: alanine:cation symporter family protein [Anaerovoracaceae bacterium]